MSGADGARAPSRCGSLFAETFLQPGDSEDDLGLRYGEMARDAARRWWPPTSTTCCACTCATSPAPTRSGLAERTSGKLPDTFEVAVAFADIVGFTALGEELPSEELSGIAERLERLADEHVRPPARIVKTIGDAVMLVSREPAALVDVMVDARWRPPRRPRTCRRCAPASRTAARSPGLATGTGPRSTSPPGSPLARAARLDPDHQRAARRARRRRGGLRFSEAGLKRFKGIADPVPVLRLRRKETG